MKKGIFLPIVVKLVFLTTVMLAAVTLLVSYKSSELFESMSTDREETTNLNISDSVSFEVDNLIQSYAEKIYFYGQEAIKNSDNLTGLSFQNDTELYGMVILKNQSIQSEEKNIKIANSKNAPSNIDLEKYILKLTDSLSSKNPFVFDGKIQVYNSSSKNNLAVFSIGIPLTKNEFGQITSMAWAFLKIDRLQKIFSSKTDRLVFMVDKDGKVLAHPKENFVLEGIDLLKHPIVKDANVSSIRTKQKYFESLENKEKMLGAFAKTATDLIVVSEVPMSVVLAPSIIVKKNSYYILGLALSITFFLIFLFSQSLTSPIEKLLLLTKEIAHGNFDVVAKNEITSHDEVGHLASAFDEMTEGLRERDKVKNLFNKFHGTAVTQELLESEINLGGKRKEVTIFFSDIRGFTDFSEGHTPEEVVSMLNEYFEIMVAIVNKHNGVVDKFIGDAMMAVWGVPNVNPDDTKNALEACLEMRMALNDLNTSRMERNLVPIKIGMGLHAGEAISGQIGSSERMEFTVIGDTVNTASRIEGATKSFGTDLLISKECLEKINYEDYILEKAGEASVQGKSENLILFRVLGKMVDGIPTILKTPYSSFEAIEDKKSKKAA